MRTGSGVPAVIGTDAANRIGCRRAAGAFFVCEYMTRFDDELEYVCAWGRWRIDQARNEPVLHASEPRPPAPAHRERERVAVKRVAVRRGRARLRLVAGPTGIVR